MTPEEREQLLAAYALGTLPGPEAAEVEALVRSDSAAARELESFHDIVDYVALAAPLRRADPRLRDRVLRAAHVSAESVRLSRWPRWQVASTVAAVAAVFSMLFWGVR